MISVFLAGFNKFFITSKEILQIIIILTATDGGTNSQLTAWAKPFFLKPHLGLDFRSQVQRKARNLQFSDIRCKGLFATLWNDHRCKKPFLSLNLYLINFISFVSVFYERPHFRSEEDYQVRLDGPPLCPIIRIVKDNKDYGGGLKNSRGNGTPPDPQRAWKGPETVAM